MTRCEEFYEKLERDGNFCGMSERDFREASTYFKSVEKDEGGKPLIPFTKWLKQKREQTKKTTPTEPVEVPNNNPEEDSEEVPNNNPEEAPDNTPSEPIENTLTKDFADILEVCKIGGVTGSEIVKSFTTAMQKFYSNFYLAVEYAESCSSCKAGAKK